MSGGSTQAELRLAGIVQLAEETFENAFEARSWLARPHPLLGGATPLQLAKTEVGSEKVRALLVSTKYGGVA